MVGGRPQTAVLRGIRILQRWKLREPLGARSTYSLALSEDDEPTLRGFFDALADGVTGIDPLEQAGWGEDLGAWAPHHVTTELDCPGRAAPGIYRLRSVSPCLAVTTVRMGGSMS